MSFAKAKRFDYKEPDLRVSPADFYISTSLEKACTISKCARFPTRSDESLASSICSRFNCRCNKSRGNSHDIPKYSRCSYDSAPNYSSTPRYKVEKLTPLDKFKQSIVNLNHEDILRSSFRNNRVKQRENIRKVKDQCENLPSSSNFWTSEEFIDDDYHSYTSSDDLDHLNRMDYHSLGARHSNYGDRNLFEKIMIEKMDEIKDNIKEFQGNLTDLQEKVNTGRNRHNNEPRMNKYHERSDSYLSLVQDNQDDLKHIIYESINNLRKEFEGRQLIILSEAIEKIRNLAKEIYLANKESLDGNKKISDDASSELYKDVIGYIEKNDTLEFESNKYEVMLGEAEKMNMETLNSFNYESICQILSDHLQESQRELDDLKREKMNIAVKCGNAQERLLAQTSIIDQLHEEIKELKKTC